MKPSVEELVQHLKNVEDDFMVRSWAAFQLGRMGAAAKDAVPPLIDALNDNSWPVRAWVAWALGEMHEAALSAVSALVWALQDPEMHVRAEAAEALGKMAAEVLRKLGPAAKDAVRLFIEALKGAAPDASSSGGAKTLDVLGGPQS